MNPVNDTPKEIRRVIEGAQRILLMAHVSEDPDAVGSLFAMREVLSLMGKEVTCMMNGPLERRMAFLGDDYTVFTEADAKEQYDLCMVLDCGSLDRLDKRLVLFEHAKATVNIDHHRTNTRFAQMNYVLPDASATGEILFGLIRELELPMNRAAAMCLYTAIASDSGAFKYANTSPDTLRAAADLIGWGFDHAEVMRRLFDCVPLNVVKLRGELMGRVESYADGRISLITVEPELLEKYGVAEEDGSDFVTIPRMIQGTEIAAELKVRGGKIKVSLRSNNQANVAEIAAFFGGGGHIRAAGASLPFDSMDEAKAAVLAKCMEQLV